jgi:AraC family L-rhamnose operon regulatory protein RhaS
VDLDVINVLFDVDALRMQTRDLHDVPGHHVLFHLEPQSRSAQQFRGRLTLSPEQRVRAGHMVEVLRAEIDGRAHGYRFASCALLMQLISYLSRCYVEQPSPEQRSLLRMGEVLSYIERNYSAPISVADLAALTAMSESSLNRAFQRLVGKAPVEYVIGVRLDKAADLLRNTDRHITEIGLACGFSDGNYFSRQFRLRMGCSPRTYRQDMRASRDGAHVNGTSLSSL